MSVEVQIWNCFSFRMVINYFRSMPTAPTKFVNLEWRREGIVSKLGHTTLWYFTHRWWNSPWNQREFEFSGTTLKKVTIKIIGTSTKKWTHSNDFFWKSLWQISFIFFYITNLCKIFIKYCKLNRFFLMKLYATDLNLWGVGSTQKNL